MTSRAACAEIRLLLPELALGTLTGEDRGRALEHLARCPECRRDLQLLSEVGDELLLLAPTAEPRVGFESRVLERIGAPRRTRPGLRAWMAAAALVAVAALLGGAAVYVAGAEDRELASGYRRTLAVADGTYFGARPLEDSHGAEVGHVFGYEGSPSWVFCVVRAARADGVYDVEITARGDVWTAGEMEVRGGRGTWAQALEVDLHDVGRIELVDHSTGKTLLATW